MRIVEAGAPTPQYWLYETGGLLSTAVMAYLRNEPMTADDITLMRRYLTQWITSPVWRGPGVDKLRLDVHDIRSRADIDAWLYRALEENIDPL
ncbi:MAG TPA: hypothetical protein VGP83_17215 [Pyrinomonadaceae bacterium]|jgi:hypothetical protein|nr:hypothetical protein [Pyrinomonadaceae bacterium]